MDGRERGIQGAAAENPADLTRDTGIPETWGGHYSDLVPLTAPPAPRDSVLPGGTQAMEEPPRRDPR